MSVIAAKRVVAVTAPSERFFLQMALACLAVGAIGFAPTYWVPLLRGTLTVAPITHLHALFFYGWLFLLVTQASLVASGRVTRHRAMGLLGVALASGMCFVGLGVAIHSLKRAIAAGFDDAARAFAIVPVSGIALFAALFAVAIVNRAKRDVHKRLMLVATIGMLQAAVGRWVLLVLAPRGPDGLRLGPPPVQVTVLPALIVDLLLVAAMIHDRRTRGRVHPAYWIAGGVTLAVQVLRVPASTSTAWMEITRWLLALAP